MSDTAEPSAGPPPGGHDLRQLFRAVGRFSGQRALTSSPPEREDIDAPVEMLEDEAAELAAVPPLDVAAFVDGIQASMTMAYRAHRPVYLSYVGAGAWDHRNLRPVGLREKLTIVGSHLDTEWISELGSSIPTDLLAVDAPPDVEKAALQALAGDRANLERQLVTDLAATNAGTLVLDGSLAGRRHEPRLVGVVKTHLKRYLADESVLYGLPAGWRSPRFVIPTGVAGGAAPRYSCYLRLFDASQEAWSFGMIRLETFDLDLLDPLGALAMSQRQSAAGGDGRWDRHLHGVRLCEEFLRARRPAVYGV